MDLSIIVCVYNTPHVYLDECLRSITESTLGLGGVEYEICVIDDGSTFDYSELLYRYGEVIRYKKIPNGGMVGARDAGILFAEGDFVAFVDSDDTVSVNYHLPMLSHARKSGADVVVNDWAFRTNNSRYYLTEDRVLSTDFSLSGAEALGAFTSQVGREQSLTVLWNKLYSRELLLSSAALMHERCGELSGFNYSEDAIRNFYVFARAKRVENIHTGYYFYRQHSAQSVNAIGADALREQIRNMSFSLDSMYSYAKEAGYTGLLPDITAWRSLMSRTHFSYAKRAGYAELYPFILDGYRVERLRTSTLGDGAVYASVRSLPDNFTEIDEAILSALREGIESLSCQRCGRYIPRIIQTLGEVGFPIKLSASAERSLPGERVSFKNRLLHNPVVYRLAMLLFPKGSRQRAILKRKL